MTVPPMFQRDAETGVMWLTTWGFEKIRPATEREIEMLKTAPVIAPDSDGSGNYSIVGVGVGT